MPRHAWRDHAGKRDHPRERIAATDPARIDGDTKRIRTGLGNLALDHARHAAGDRTLFVAAVEEVIRHGEDRRLSSRDLDCAYVGTVVRR